MSVSSPVVPISVFERVIRPLFGFDRFGVVKSAVVSSDAVSFSASSRCAAFLENFYLYGEVPPTNSGSTCKPFFTVHILEEPE